MPKEPSLPIAMRQLQRRLQIGSRCVGKRYRGPAFRAPCVGNGGKHLWRHFAFEQLLLGRELEIGGLPVRRQRREDNPHTKSHPLEMRRFRNAWVCERQSAEIVGGGHGPRYRDGGPFPSRLARLARRL